MTHIKNQSFKPHRLAFALVSLLAISACQTGTAATPSASETKAATPATESTSMESKMTEDTSASLVLTIKGYKEQTGKILVALYADEASFDAETAPLKEGVMSADKPMTIVTFNDMPAGDYAYKLYHDANDNGKLDTSGFGIPTEDYFFSNDASDPFSAPEWGESKFTLTSGRTTHEVDLN